MYHHQISLSVCRKSKQDHDGSEEAMPIAPTQLDRMLIPRSKSLVCFLRNMHRPYVAAFGSLLLRMEPHDLLGQRAVVNRKRHGLGRGRA